MGATHYVQNPSSGTYFHKRLNLSVNAQDGTCSLVFGTDEPVNQVVAELANGALAVLPKSDIPRDIDITSTPHSDGLRYFRMAIQR